MTSKPQDSAVFSHTYTMPFLEFIVDNFPLEARYGCRGHFVHKR
jgi:hypothetical protein